MSVLPQDETGKAEYGYDYDFGMPNTAIWVDDGAGGVELWDGNVTLAGDILIAVDDLEQYTLDQLFHYKFSGWTVSGTAVYLGYEDKDGNFYIQYFETSTGVVLFHKDTGGIPAPGTWSGLAYASFASTF